MNFSLISCVNNMKIYDKNISNSDIVYEEILKDEVLVNNSDNKFSASKALNEGIQIAHQDWIICCHQDVSFPKGWLSKVVANIEMAKVLSKNKLGVLGTAGVLDTGEKRGYMQDGNYGYWNDGGVKFGTCQTLDECCLIFDKSTGLRFDENFNDFHFYGADLCLQALDRGLYNFGIDAPPLIHYSGGGESSLSGNGRKIFEREMLKLKRKWIKRFSRIWTTTCILYPHREVILADYIKRK